MKQNKILKILSYIILSISIATMILSAISFEFKNSTRYDKETYFSSETFAYDYIRTITNIANKLIYNNANYPSTKDGDIEIYYLKNYYSENGYIVNEYFNSSEVAEINFLLIYNNKAITNVDSNSIDDIKHIIKTSADNTNATNDAKIRQANILNGEIQADSDVLEKYGTKYLNNFMITYYTTDTEKTDTILSDGRYIEYVTPTAKDFEVYTSYTEELSQDEERQLATEFLNAIEPISQNAYIILPISSAVTILLIIYLLITIGHKNDEKTIELNDFDKIPLEIILVVAAFLVILPFIILSQYDRMTSAMLSLGITTYLDVYIVSAVVLHTLIKRIKAKTFLSSSIIGQVLIWWVKIFKKLLSKLKKVWNTITYSASITSKVIIGTGIITFIWLVIISMFSDNKMLPLIIVALICFIVYKIIKILKEYSQIENKLKDVYNGNNQTELKEEDFSMVFKSSVKYLNNISNGLENAVQERMKSERMKAELITNVSHDIKTPLTSIINYVDLLKKEDIANEKANEYINILDNKSQRLKKLTEDLIEASKVSTGNVSLNLEKINIVELIKQAIGEFEDKFQNKNLQIIINCNENEININADSRYMYRVVENLFSNIYKYALENSRVYIDISIVNDTNVVIEMKNISKDKLNISADELMQRFVRGDRSRNTEGSGLGISIAQNLTELQNGTFELKLDGDLFKVKLTFYII